MYLNVNETELNYSSKLNTIILNTDMFSMEQSGFVTTLPDWILDCDWVVSQDGTEDVSLEWLQSVSVTADLVIFTGTLSADPRWQHDVQSRDLGFRALIFIVWFQRVSRLFARVISAEYCSTRGTNDVRMRENLLNNFGSQRSRIVFSEREPLFQNIHRTTIYGDYRDIYFEFAHSVFLLNDWFRTFTDSNVFLIGRLVRTRQLIKSITGDGPFSMGVLRYTFNAK